MKRSKISELPTASSVGDTDIFPVRNADGTRKISKADFLKTQSWNKYTHTAHDYGTLSSGTFTPDCANGYYHKITVTGNITLAVPTAIIGSGLKVSGMIEIVGADLYTVTLDANYRWLNGTPTLTAKSLIEFYRKDGDTLTQAWHRGGFS